MQRIIYNAMFKINETAACIFERLDEEISYERLCEETAKHFSVEIDIAKESVESIFSKLRELNLLAE